MPEIQYEKQELIITFLLSVASRFRNEKPPSLFRIVEGSRPDMLEFIDGESIFAPKGFGRGEKL